MEHIDVIFKTDQTEEQKSSFLISEYERIENSGLKIIGAEPIEKIYVKILGKRFFVE